MAIATVFQIRKSSFKVKSRRKNEQRDLHNFWNGLWLLSSMVIFQFGKKIEPFFKVPKTKEESENRLEIFLTYPWWRPCKTKILTPLLRCCWNDKASLTKHLKLNEIKLETKYFQVLSFLTLQQSPPWKSIEGNPPFKVFR